MFNIGHYQIMDSRYGGQLADQLKRIELAVHGGQDVTIRLVDGDRQMTLSFKGGQVFECSEPSAPPAGQKPPTLADNDGLVAFGTGSFAFDLPEAEREIPSREVKRGLREAAALRVDDEKIRARLAAGLPLTEISQMGSDEYFLVSNCSYRANDGYTITALKGFRTDLASIPRLLTVLISVQDLSITAPTFHDLLYRSGGDLLPPLGVVSPHGKLFTKLEADDLFLELMTREQVSFFKRNFAYAAVRLAGRSAWKGG